MKSKEFTFKSRSSPVVVLIPPNVDYSIATGAALATWGGGLTTVSNVVEKIASTNSGYRKHRRSNKCMHSKITDFATYGGPITILRNTRTAPTLRTVFNGQVGIGQAGSIIAIDAAKVALGGNAGFDYLANNGQSLTDQNFDRLRPDLTELSVPNFLLDWRQIAGLWKVWNSRRGVLANAADKNLQYQYGWRPTLGDVAALIGSIASLHDKLETWRQSLGKHIRHRVTCLVETESKSGSQAYLSWGHLDWSATRSRSVTAHIQFRPLPIADLTVLEKVIKGYLDILGFELNPAIIWDKIPFSFVVDWFIGIGKYLERLKLDTLELPFVLEDFYLQYKERFYVDSTVTELETANFPRTRYPGAAHSEIYFHRWQFAPSLGLSSNLGWKSPTRNQAGLGLSLLISNAWK